MGPRRFMYPAISTPRAFHSGASAAMTPSAMRRARSRDPADRFQRRARVDLDDLGPRLDLCTVVCKTAQPSGQWRVKRAITDRGDRCAWR